MEERNQTRYTLVAVDENGKRPPDKERETIPTPEDTSHHEEPYSWPIELIHRGQDGHVTFHTKDGGQWRDLFAVEARQLPLMFPEFKAQLAREAFFSLSAMSVTRRYQSKAFPKLKAPTRRGDCVRWLGVSFADLDCYKRGLTPGQALGALVDMQDAGAIPPASIFCRSGQGLWALWLIGDEKDIKIPVRAWPEKVELWARLQAALQRKLSHLGFDEGAKDAARVAPVGGTLRTKIPGGERVMYWVQLMEGGRLPAYTLKQMALALDVSLETRRPMLQGGRTYKAPPGSALRSRAAKGWVARWGNWYRNWYILRDLRGGRYGKGCRNRALLILAQILLCRGFSGDDLDQEMRDTVRESLDSHPDSLTDRDAMAAITEAQRYKAGDGFFKAQTVADWLLITPDEARYLKGWPCATQYTEGPSPSPDETGGRAADMEKRRAAIRQLVESHKGGIPPLRAIVAHLEALRIEAVPQTIARDLKALKLRNPRRWSEKKTQAPLFKG